jgi:hypothetical protein
MTPVRDEMPCPLSHQHFAEILDLATSAGYRFATCVQVAAAGSGSAAPLLVLRHDVDLLPERAVPVGVAEHERGIPASYFFRVHANEYNALSHQTLAIMRELLAMGHEIGLHAEPLDLAASCGVDPTTGVRAAARVLGDLLGVPIQGVASHNDVTPDNNLDFFRAIPATDLGLRYEAYDDRALGLFGRSWYVTDGYYWHWRTFRDGALTDDRSCLCKHVAAGRAPLYTLIHPHVWYARHPHRPHH